MATARSLIPKNASARFILCGQFSVELGHSGIRIWTTKKHGRKHATTARVQEKASSSAWKKSKRRLGKSISKPSVPHQKLNSLAADLRSETVETGSAGRQRGYLRGDQRAVFPPTAPSCWSLALHLLKWRQLPVVTKNVCCPCCDRCFMHRSHFAFPAGAEIS